MGIAAEHNRLSTLKILLQHGAPHDQPNRMSCVFPIISAKLNKNLKMEMILQNPEAFLSEHPQARSDYSFKK